MRIPFSLKESNGDFSKNYESNSGTISFVLKIKSICNNVLFDLIKINRKLQCFS